MNDAGALTNKDSVSSGTAFKLTTQPVNKCLSCDILFGCVSETFLVRIAAVPGIKKLTAGRL